MTFTARPIAPLKIDILSVTDPASLTAGQQIPCTGSPSETRATVSSGQVTVYSGSHWRIEFSPCFNDGAWEIELYSVTDGARIGFTCWGTSPSYTPLLKGRVCACALILDSDISTSKVIEARIVSQTNMGSQINNIYYPNAGGRPTFRIMELPA
jgi:hypothetical protein